MIENYITSFVEGRVRVRHAIFKDEQIVAQVLELLQNLPGVESLKHNVRTGSILLEYDVEVLEKETLLGLLKQGEQWFNLDDVQPEPKKLSSCMPVSLCNMTTREKRKLFNRTMAVSLGMTAIALGVGNKRIHVLAGSVFLGLSFWHIKRMHKSLL